MNKRIMGVTFGVGACLALAVTLVFHGAAKTTALKARGVEPEQATKLTEAEPVPRILAEHSAPKIHVPVRGVRANILMYHHVGSLPSDADALRRDLTVSIGDFEAQVAWLSARGYQSLTLAQVLDATEGGSFVMPKKPVVFTFDDGYADVFENAVPILKKYNMVGSFAVVPGFLGTPDYATWQQVEAAKQEGMEIVSHTENHFDGSSAKFDAAYIKANLAQSLAELTAHVGPVPQVLVYPYGHYTDEYIRVAKEVGFKLALTTKFGFYVDLEDLMHTPRVRVHGGEPLDRFIDILSGVKSVTKPLVGY